MNLVWSWRKIFLRLARGIFLIYPWRQLGLSQKWFMRRFLDSLNLININCPLSLAYWLITIFVSSTIMKLSNINHIQILIFITVMPLLSKKDSEIFKYYSNDEMQERGIFKQCWWHQKHILCLKLSIYLRSAAHTDRLHISCTLSCNI